MKIYEVVVNKRDYMDLLFLADEQEDMIDKYLDKGTMYVLDDDGVKGDSPLTIPFYEKCGFRKHHKIKNFFLDNYDHPIIEEGVQLVDMVYLRKEI